ncbi:multidrug efflux pump subunit AcrB [Xanthomonas arboricola]
MRANISSWSINNPIATSLLFMLLTLAGVGGFMAMKVQDFPDIDIPIITVTAPLPGASPTQLENDVARRIEDALANLQGIKHIRSTLTDGAATVTAEFEVGKPVQDAMNDVRDAVGSTRADLPPDLLDLVITRAAIASTPVLTYTVSSSQMDQEALSWFVDGELSRRLLGSSGVGAVVRAGGVDREIRIDLDAQRLFALNTTAAGISRQIRQVQQESTGGRVESGSAEQSVRILGTLDSASQIGQLEIALPDGRRVRLDEIASVRDTTANQRTMALLDGQQIVAFDVLRTRGAGELDVASASRATIDAMRVAHPHMVFTEAVNRVDPIADNYHASLMLLIEGAALAVCVVFLFLRDWRATVIAAVALPLSAIPTFAAMHMMGFTLNTVTLLSLSLVVGVLVDDAIVEIENIERHMRMGKPPVQASHDATREIGLAVIATTLTLVAVFLPTSLMGGVVGLYFVQFGWTAAVAVLFSLLVARMLTPMMAAYMLKAPQREAHTPRWTVIYLRLARLCLQHRRLTVAGAMAVVSAGLFIATLLPGEFMPPDEGDRVEINITLPPGSRLSDTLVVAEQARQLLTMNPLVRSVYSALGTGGAANGDPGDHAPSASDATTAALTANLVPRSERGGGSRQQVETELRTALRDLTGVRVQVGGGNSEGYELVLAGDDGVQLDQFASKVARELRQIPGIGAVTSSASLTRPELVIRPDFVRAADLGVDSASIGEALRIATAGDYAQDLAKLNLSDRQVPIVVRLSDRSRDDIETLRRLPVQGARGAVPLESVATLQITSGPAELTRYDRQRNVTLKAELNGVPLGVVEQAAGRLPTLQTLPDGITRAAAGDAEVMADLVTGFGVAMLAGLVCIYALLVLLLKDFAQPLTVLLALVLSIPGAFLALLITGSTLSMPSMIGLIMLMGITTKNSILLVDYIVIAQRDHGLGRRAAVVDACRKRARPIVMTTVAMGAGMLPIAIGLGADPSFRAPMAIAVIGGLLSSTVLSLLVIPVVYSLVEDGKRVLARSFRRAQGGGLPPTPEPSSP